MIGEHVTNLLHALATGYPDAALDVITHLEVDEDVRGRLWAAVTESPDPASAARLVGDHLHAAALDSSVVNECYRAAFYMGDDWVALSDNPLFNRFQGNRSGPVLDKWVHYFPVYHRQLARYRGASPKLLEIGVYRGGGLAMWDWYLGAGTTVVGVDIDPAAVTAVAGRYRVVLGDQSDPDFLRALAAEHGPFDIIIDDGGHEMHQQIASIETLFPLLNQGGTYIVEDTHTSYWSSHGGGLRRTGTFVEWTKHRLDDLHAWHDGDIDTRSVWATELDGVDVHDSIVTFHKKSRHRPFSEVTGTSSYLVASRWTEAIGITLVATRDAAIAERDAARKQLADDPRIARTELVRLQHDAARLAEENAVLEAQLRRHKNQLLESWDQLKAMRATTSWRATFPLRSWRRLIGR